MSHRVNFKVYRLGKTIKWNFSSPLINVQRALRLNYVMLHWVKRALIDRNIKIFKFFYTISPDFPFIKVIGYRKLYIKPKKIFSNYSFTLKSSQVLDSDNLFAFSKGRRATKLTFYRQREKNRKLAAVRETPKYRKASYKNVLLPLLASSKDSLSILYNFFLLEVRSSLSTNNHLFFCNWTFNHNFLLNTFAIFSLFGSMNAPGYFHFSGSRTPRPLVKAFSHVALILQSALKVESSGWFKFFTSYSNLFFNYTDFQKNENAGGQKKAAIGGDFFNVQNFKFASYDDIHHFFLLKKSLFIVKLVLKNYPQAIFLNDGRKISENSIFLLNILRFYFFIFNDKNFDTRFTNSNAVGQRSRKRPSTYMVLKLNSLLKFFKSVKNFNLFLIDILKNSKKISFWFLTRAVSSVLLTKWRALLSEVTLFWTRDLSKDYKKNLNKFEAAAQLSTQVVSFLSNTTNVRCPPMAEFFVNSSSWWKSRYFLGRTFNYDSLYHIVLSRNKYQNFSADYLVNCFSTFFSNSSILKYFKAWSYTFLNSSLDDLSFNAIDENSSVKKSKQKYVRPIKHFADIDKTLSTKVPNSYKNLLKFTSKSSSVFSFSNYEQRLRLKLDEDVHKKKPNVFFKKQIDNLLFLIAKTKNEELRFLIKTKSGNNLSEIVEKIAAKISYSFKKTNFNIIAPDFYYSIKIVKLLENSLTFWRASQLDLTAQNALFKESFFKAGIFSFSEKSYFNRSAKVPHFALKFNSVFDHLFVNSGKFLFINRENINLFYLKNSFSGGLVYLQNIYKNSLILTNIVFSYTNPSATPAGAVKYKRTTFKNYAFCAKTVSHRPFPFFLLNFDFFSYDFLFDRRIIPTLQFKHNFSVFFKTSILFNAAPSLETHAFTFFYSMFYFINNYVLSRKMLLSNDSMVDFSYDLPELCYKNNIVNVKAGNLSKNKLKIFNLVKSDQPRLESAASLNEFFLESFYLLNLSSSFFKIFGVSYEVIFYPINKIFQDNARFQFLVSQAGDFLRAYVSRNPYILYWLNEFIILFYASISTRSTKALSQFMAARFKKEYYWNQPAAFMFSVIRSIWLHEFGILGLRIGFHGKFGGQERAYRLYKNWGANPCLRNGLLTGSHSSSRCHSKYGITDIHIWLVYY